MKAPRHDGDRPSTYRRRSLRGHTPSVPVNGEGLCRTRRGRTHSLASDITIVAPKIRVRVCVGSNIFPAGGSLTAVLDSDGPETADAITDLPDLTYDTSDYEAETVPTEGICCRRRSYRGRFVNEEGYRSRQIHRKKRHISVEGKSMISSMILLNFRMNYLPHYLP